jgi:putative transcriptional regulator
MKKPAKKASETFDWSRFDAMTDAQIHAAALADPDAQPLTERQLARMKPMSRVKLLRVRLRLTQDQFSKRYGIPLTTLRDWEQYRSEPPVPFLLAGYEGVDPTLYHTAVADAAALSSSYDPETQTARYPMFAGTALTYTTTETGNILWLDTDAPRPSDD